MSWNHNWKKGIIGIMTVSMLAACSSNDTSNEPSSSEGTDYNKLTLAEIEEKAKTEGEVNSVGMPDTWANWVETWNELGEKYQLKHTDTDMSSAEELQKFAAEKEDATADIGDVGIAFGPIAEDQDLTLAYKTSYWDEIPNWAKDDNGDWVVGYTGSMAVMTDKNNVKNAPTSWADIKNGDFTVSIGDALTANQAQFAILAAAYAFGGDENNIQPGIDFFAELAKKGRLTSIDPSVANLEKGEVDVALMWDFNALGYREQIDAKRFDVTIPKEASVTSGYATIINKYSKNPHAAMLTREYILSDEGQENLAKGYARPIRENVELSEDVESLLLPDEMYENAKPVADQKAWEETTKNIPQIWQEQVLIHVK
ncbi:ABC transporter substrate-binding protein [Metabacillus sediminilitoris]|uniref:ABC transporter substrate-binding protein n=1 Tax=Metabacillus sediminilitoris TaxID=2567941 RepID=A0A4S4BT75_9BACI|nr:ABC transporter substrate-binding protein [Metabacillus sediminilitoris]QGQ44277.1 ABC transporter substrate-binding protein [Metabacillus sediminilitoris]THF78240.1 ABC transporter substrate-binding protein [Metabacillus sediminilitoris]